MSDEINTARDDAYVARVLAAGGFARTTAPDDVAARTAIIAAGGVRAATRRGWAVGGSQTPGPVVGEAEVDDASDETEDDAEAEAAPSPPPVATPEPAAAVAPPPRAASTAPVLRPIRPMDDLGDINRNPIAPPPKISWIPVDRLVIDEGYQRAIGKRGRQNIVRLIQGWDWNCYKPLSVAPVEGRDGFYEVVDGQHSAIAAATHGAIELLPALVLSARSRAEKASAFLGINRDRVTLTAFALFRARLASGEPVAVEVGDALDQAGVVLVESLQAVSPGDTTTVRTAAVGTLSTLVRRGGGALLARLLAVAVAGRARIVPAGLLMGLEAVLAREDAPPDDRLSRGIARVGVEAMGESAMRLGRGGDRAGRVGVDAWVKVLLDAARSVA